MTWKRLDYENTCNIRYSTDLPPIKYLKLLKPGEQSLVMFRVVLFTDSIVTLFENELRVRSWKATGTRRLGEKVGTEKYIKDKVLEAFSKDKELKHILKVMRK